MTAQERLCANRVCGLPQSSVIHSLDPPAYAGEPIFADGLRLRLMHVHPFVPPAELEPPTIPEPCRFDFCRHDRRKHLVGVPKDGPYCTECDGYPNEQQRSRFGFAAGQPLCAHVYEPEPPTAACSTCDRAPESERYFCCQFCPPSDGERHTIKCDEKAEPSPVFVTGMGPPRDPEPEPPAVAVRRCECPCIPLGCARPAMEENEPSCCAGCYNGEHAIKQPAMAEDAIEATVRDYADEAWGPAAKETDKARVKMILRAVLRRHLGDDPHAACRAQLESIAARIEAVMGNMSARSSSSATTSSEANLLRLYSDDLRAIANEIRSGK